MKFIVPFGLAIALCAGCSSPVIYSQSDMDNDKPATGEIQPLSSLIPADTKTIRLVFVHGVGDHCSGYALGERDGWLNTTTAAAIGMTPRSGEDASGKIFSSVFTGAAFNERSFVEYQVKGFSLKLTDGRSLPVDAIEITWSHLTQWIKSNQLGYDSPSVTPSPGKSDGACVQAPSASTPDGRNPPGRLWLDRTIKEKVFDRNLADAVLYSGSYGGAMEKGVAEALCHAVAHQPDSQGCTWPDARNEATYTNIFVTHSLGSRLVYDVILDLMRTDRPGRENPFPPAPANDFVAAMLGRSAAFYMMANQLSLLGLAHVPEKADPSAGPIAAGFGLVDRSDGDVLATLIEKRREVVQSVPRLELVSFNDTNDLLTWHIPNWYAKSEAARAGSVQVNVTNVFVRNAFPWLIVEDPTAAHDNYFENGTVWQAIRCGGNAGALTSC